MKTACAEKPEMNEPSNGVGMGSIAPALFVPSQIIRTPFSTNARSRPPGRQAFVLTAVEPITTGGWPGACATKARP